MRNALFMLGILLLISTVALAAEPVPRNDFISITDKALDALDEVEAIFERSTTSTKKEARDALKKLDIALKKYDRYITREWPKGKQQQIVENLTACHLSYEVYLFGLSAHKDDEDLKDKARDAGQNARDLFSKYRGRKVRK